MAIARWASIIRFSVLAVAIPTAATAQSPGAATPTALKSLIGRWCWTPLVRHDTAVAAFAGVRFIEGTCRSEHDDPLYAIVGIDADSVLYLLASEHDFNFLVARHPPTPLHSASTALDYTRIALRLSGYAMPSERLVTSWTQLPVAARAGAKKVAVRPVQVVHEDNNWTLRFFLISEGAFGPYVTAFNVLLESGGRIGVQRVWQWRAMVGP